MAEEERERFVIEHEGEEHLFEELFHFTVPDSGVSYMVLAPTESGQADADEDEEEVEVFAFRFEENEQDNGVSFYPIETEEEWDIVEEMLNTFSEEE